MQKRVKQRINACSVAGWWDWCMSEDIKKEIKPFLIDEKLYKFNRN